ncbi:MAG TPA: metallophosphoesterase [Candidatus Acidoferrum sp.]|nr:metallophosphoesterase [Candidatus Acidoferrum sp.]
MNEFDPKRRATLQCMGMMASAGVLWTLVGGVPRAIAADSSHQPMTGAGASPFTFGQISDTHIGFNKAANPEPDKTAREAIARLQQLKPGFVLHTGDITQLSKTEEFDTAASLMQDIKSRTFYVPGEHDVLDEGGGKLYLERYGKGSKGNGWYSFDDHGVHFVALVNVFNLEAGHMAKLGSEQIAWLKDDLRGVGNSTPVVVFTHIPLWTVYEPWGWGTEDGDQALALLRSYGSVTVLNGHIHQVIQKVEGDITFHTARSTAFPQPAPGKAASPGPMAVPAEQLRSYLGITEVKPAPGLPGLQLLDTALARNGG